MMTVYDLTLSFGNYRQRFVVRASDDLEAFSMCYDRVTETETYRHYNNDNEVVLDSIEEVEDDFLYADDEPRC